MFKQLCENFKDPNMQFFWRISENCPPDRSSHSRNFFFILQVQLYEDLTKFQVKKGLEETVSHMDEENKNEDASKDNPHVFQVSIDFILSAIRLFYLFNCEFDHGHQSVLSAYYK